MVLYHLLARVAEAKERIVQFIFSRSDLRTAALAAVLVAAGGLHPAAAQPAFPLKPSVNGRYLVDQNNAPFLMIGDAPQAMVGNLSTADATVFIKNRAKYGVNALWVNLLCDGYTACNSDGSSFDGVAPFTAHLSGSCSDYNLTKPNAAYFNRAAAIINKAAQFGMVVLLDPIET